LNRDRTRAAPIGIRARSGVVTGGACGVRVIGFDEPLVMGVVNVTPDSFSDGGQTFAAAAAIAHGQALWRAGAHVLDIGGEASNPRAQPVTTAVELARVLPVIEALATTTDAVISIDTTKAAVAQAAIAVGADLVNDISGGLFDPAILGIVDDAGVGYVCGHVRGATLAAVFAAEGPVAWTAVRDELAVRLAQLPASLVGRTLVDPGLGFGKGGDESNLILVARAGDLAHALGRPILIGASRKRFVRRLLSSDPTPDALDDASVGVSLAAIAAGAHVVRVHDVRRMGAALAGFCGVTRSFVASAPSSV
jgi:dihydropteroate synthase